MRDMKDSGIEWIGEIPASWSTNYIKNLFYTVAGSTPKSERTEYWDGEILWITPADYKTEDMYVSAGKRNITAEGYKSCSTTLVPKNSIIFSKRAPIGTVAINTNELCTNQGCIACVKKEECSEEYYYYVMSVASEHFELLGSGTTFKEISANSFANVKLPFPSEEEQRKIAHYLNNQCKAINALKEDIQSQISSLEEYKRSVITEAVTKGLNADVEMKDSGVEWIGQIPKKWETIKIGHIFSLRNERNFLPEEEVQLLSLYTGIGVFPQGEHTTASGNHAQTVMGYKVVHKNDIVVNIILAWMGAIGVSDYDGVTSPAYDVYIPDLTKVVPHYFHYVFRTSGIAGECYKYGRGIMMMRWRTYSQEFKQIIVPFPSLEEQKIIADYLDTKCTEIDNAILEKKKQLETLEQYKKSLIYEYVTGKKEVPNE